MSGYAIRFDIEDVVGVRSVFYAGRTPDGGLGFAPSLESAEIWPTEEVAGNFLRNGYGPNMAKVGTIVHVVDGQETFDVREYDVTPDGGLEPREES